MKKLDLGQTIAIVANVGVIAGIVFLAVEVGQNTEMMRSQTRDSITEKQMAFSAWVIGSPELAAALTKNLDDLSPSELAMINYHWAGSFRAWENSHYQYRRGLFEEEEFEPRRNTWRRGLRNPNVQAMWERRRDGYSPAFRAEIDEIIRGLGSE